MNKIDFYINKFAYVSDIDNLDVSFIPAILRRRLSSLNKTSFYVFEKCFSEEIKNIVYTSRYGEFDKLKKLIEAFSIDKCVSPTTFSSSVHNGTVGAYLHNNKFNIPYVALASTENTLSMGLLHSVINGYDTNLFCYSDYINEKPFSVALTVSKEPIGQHFVISLEKSKTPIELEEKELLISLLNKETASIQFNNYRIEAI